MKRILFIALGLVVVLVVIIMFTKGSGNLTIEVTVEKAKRRNITETVSASGKVQPEVQVKISSDVSGEIVDLYVKEGDTVKQGQLLAKIDPKIYFSVVERAQAAVSTSRANLANSKARLTQVQAQFANADASFARSKKLFDQGAISQAEFDQAKATYETSKADVQATMETVSASDFNVNSAMASLKEASDNLNKTSIYAPVGGTVSKLNVEKGERVVGTSQMAGTELLIIANLYEMEVSVEVNENDILRVHTGDTASVEVDAYNNRKFKGIVTEVANSANTVGLSADQVTNFPVKVRILRGSYSDLMDPAKPSQFPFRPGMSATVDIMTKSALQVITVPIQSVTTRNDTVKGKTMDIAGKQEAAPEEEEDQGEVKATDVKEKDRKTAAEKTETITSFECVFVLRDGKAKLVPVKVGVQDNMYIEIVRGLKEGDEVISGPYSAVSRQLYNGAEAKLRGKDWAEKKK
ncbi:MAG: HlyD family secretion protein [Bacteroidetes bacterium]|nr:MAG: HlyD family secretion protein [Bacteroidota bacterium]